MQWPLPYFVKVGERRKVLDEYESYVERVDPYVPFHLLARTSCVNVVPGRTGRSHCCTLLTNQKEPGRMRKRGPRRPRNRPCLGIALSAAGTATQSRRIRVSPASCASPRCDVRDGGPHRAGLARAWSDATRPRSAPAMSSKSGAPRRRLIIGNIHGDFTRRMYGCVQRRRSSSISWRARPGPLVRDPASLEVSIS